MLVHASLRLAIAFVCVLVCLNSIHHELYSKVHHTVEIVVNITLVAALMEIKVCVD